MEKHIKDAFNEEVLNLAVSRFDIDINTVKEIGGFENLIYSFTRDDKEYILRISHSDHRDVNNVSAELEFINFLSINKADVSRPIKSKNNQLVEPLGDKEPCFIATAFEKAEGAPPTKEDGTDEFFIEYGRVVARMHKITKEFKPINFKRMEWDEDVLVKNACKYLPQEKEKICLKYKETLDEIYKLPKDIDSYGLIHTDIHMGNFFVDNNKFTVFDFDDAAYMWFISDIAIYLFYLLWFTPDEYEKVDSLMSNFMKGYNEINKLDDYWFEKLPLFLKLREILIYVVIYRSFDQDNLPDWAKKYIEIYEYRILNDIPFLDLDFTKYNK